MDNKDYPQELEDYCKKLTTSNLLRLETCP